MMGDAVGLDLRMDGARMSWGSWRRAWLTADCTSCAAASMSRLSANWSVMFVDPSELRDVMSSSPGIVANCRSRGVATAAAMVSGLAPGSDADTDSVG